MIDIAKGERAPILVNLPGFYEGELVVLPVSSAVQLVRGEPAVVQGEALALWLVAGAVFDGYVDM